MHHSNGPTRKCRRCQRFHSIDDFLKESYSKDGIGTICKTCRSKKYRAYVLKNAKQFDPSRFPKQKLCQHCHIVKVQMDFTVSRSSADGLDDLCRACKSEQWKRQPKKSQRYKIMWVKYRLTPERYHAILERQKNRCPLCLIDLTKVRRPAIDHCHATNKVRGVLCNQCNSGLGPIERPGFLQKALEYINIHR